MELEMKWRLLDGPPSTEGSIVQRLTQGYLQIDPYEDRVRSDGTTNWLTFKGDGEIARPEWETEIPDWVYAARLAQTELIIVKDRYPFPAIPGFRWLLDIFHGKHEGLIMVELEPIETNTSNEDMDRITAELRAIPLDVRFGHGIDVTADKRYKNKWLAQNGVPPLKGAA